MTVQDSLVEPNEAQKQLNVPARVKLSDEELLAKYSSPHRQPEIGSVEEGEFKGALARQRLRNIRLSRKTTDKDLGDVLSDSSGLDKGERARIALEVHKQLKKNKRRARLVFWSGWLFFLSLVSGLAFLGYIYAMNNIRSERYTIPYSCTFKYGDSELEGRRSLSLPVKSLSGWRWTPPWSTVDERVEIVLKGDPIIFVGVDNKGKTWRKEFSKGEFGTAILPNSQTYWVLGKNVKETLVIQHADFCK